MINRLTHDEKKFFHKNCPLSFDRICGRKFHVPNYRQADYYNQDLINELWIDYLLAYGAGLYGFKDEVNNSAFASFSQLLTHNKPVYFLERELGEAFVRTKLPLDMLLEDINWKHEAFRVMLPKDLLTIEREGEPKNIMYLDICKIAKGEELKIPKELRGELNRMALQTVLSNNGPYLRPFDTLCGIYDFEGYITLGHLDHRELAETSYVIYANVKPWGNLQVQTLFDIVDQLKVPKTVFRDNLDDLLLAQMEHLALTILLYLSAVPLEYEPIQILRKKQITGKHAISELVEAKFVGASQIRAQMLERPISRTPGLPTGRTVAPHAVAGHWRRIPYGPKQSLRRLTWIHPYLTKQPPPEK
jgi:hypothetical protein